MDEEYKKRLEQELRFLKESLEADVISRDEYERGKERIERKLEEIEESETREEEKPEEEIQEVEEEIAEKEEGEEELKEPEIEIKEIKEKPTKIIFPDEEEPETKEAEEPEEKEEAPEAEEKKEEEIEEEQEEKEKEPETKEEEEQEEIKLSKKWLYGLAILIIAIILFFSIRSCSKPIGENQTGENITEEPIPKCSSNSDCKEEGMIGICSSPGTKEAKCEFKEDASINLQVMNDKNCKLCDSSSTENIVKEIFPNVKIAELDYSTAEAKKLISKFDINALPAYIFDSNVSEAANFEDFKTALIKKGSSYIMTNTASGASYYFKRPLIKNKLDLYNLPETTERIESPMQEVSNLFKDKMNFTKHIVTEEQKETLEKELAINTYPAFLLNNQLTFRGILPANTIKEKICAVTYFEECSKELSKI